MSTEKSFRPLKKQQFRTVKSLVIIFYFILASSLPIMFSAHTLLVLMTLTVACGFAAYIHLQFVKYLNNFTVYANIKSYLKVTVVGFILLSLGLVLLCLGAGFDIPGIILAVAGGLLWLGSMVYVVDNISGNVDDYVGGFSGASLCMEGLSTYWFLILFFPLFVYNVFIYAEEYAQEYGVAE